MMKCILSAFGIVAALASAAPAQAQSIALPTELSQGLVDFLARYDGRFSGGLHQGIQAYGALIECSRPEGIVDPLITDCAAAPMGGFSRPPYLGPVPLPAGSAMRTQLIRTLRAYNFVYVVGNGFLVLGGRLFCESGGFAPSCRIDR